MSAKFSQYDMVRIELFEMLFPKMIYSGTVEEQDRFFYALKEDGMNLVHDMYESMCEQDKIQYPYEKNDFSVKTLDRGGVGMIQINIPEQNEQMNDVYRAYVLYTNREKKKKKIGSILLLNVSVAPEMCLYFILMPLERDF